MRQWKTSLAITPITLKKESTGRKMLYRLLNQMTGQQFGEDYPQEVIIGLTLMMVLLSLQSIWLLILIQFHQKVTQTIGKKLVKFIQL